MLSDLVKILEIFINTLQGSQVLNTSAKKRKKFAKTLLKIHVLMDEIIFRGSQILAFFDEKANHTRVDYQAIRLTVLAQNKAINTLLDEIKQKDVSGLLNLYVPEFRQTEITEFLVDKDRMLYLFLSQYLDDQVAFSNQIEQRRLEIEKMTFDSAKSSNINIYELSFPKGINDIVISATEGQIKKTKRLLMKLAKLKSEIRVLLTEKFSLEEML
jgi:hypothetical protein